MSWAKEEPNCSTYTYTHTHTANGKPYNMLLPDTTGSSKAAASCHLTVRCDEAKSQCQHHIHVSCASDERSVSK